MALLLQNLFLVTIMVAYWYAIWEDLTDFKFYVKPSVLVLMFVFFIANNSQFGLNKRAILIAAGLILSAGGDYFLMWTDEQNFIKGLVSFAVAHIAYILSFIGDIFASDEGKGRAGYLAQLLAFVMFMFAYQFNNLLQPFVPQDLKVPVFLYSILLSGMVAFSMYRNNKVSDASFMWTAVGAVLFALSDSTLSFDLFVPDGSGKKNKKLFELAVMVTYYLGQLFIFNGAVVGARGANAKPKDAPKHLHGPGCNHDHAPKTASGDSPSPKKVKKQ